MRAYWRKHFILLEAALMFLVVAGIVVWSEKYGGWTLVNAQLAGNRPTVYGTIAGILGSLLGFVMAAFAIVIGSRGTTLRLTPIEEHYRTIARVFTFTIVVLGLGTVSSLLALVFDRDASAVPGLVYMVVGSMLLAASGIARCTWILYNIVAIVGLDQSRSATD